MNHLASPMHSAAIRIRSAFMPDKDVAEALPLLADQVLGRHPQVVDERARWWRGSSWCGSD